MSLKYKLYLTLTSTILVLLLLGTAILLIRENATANALALQQRSYEKIVLAREIQVHFKKQVQEWKNILLRGNNPEDYENYLYLFFREENIARRKINQLLERGDTSDSVVRLANQFLETHMHLGIQYRKALSQYSANTKKLDHREADKIVRAIDRAPTESLDQIVTLVQGAYQQQHQQIKADLKRTQMWVFALSLLALLVSVWQMLNLANKLIAEITTDKTTGLLNRRQLLRKIAKHIKQKRCAHLLLIDIDQFKLLNEVCGHRGADQYLISVGQLVKDFTRNDDLLFRSNADEFVVICQHTHIEQARELGSRIRKAIGDMPFTWNKAKFRQSASVAIVKLNNHYGSVEQVFNHLDIALQQAKESGRNRVMVYDENCDLMQLAQQQMRAVHNVHDAIAENRLALFKQEIASIQGDAQSHYEILVRMYSTTGELVSPHEFLPAAEKYNIIDRIDNWVISHLCEYMQLHPNDTSHFSVNLSAASLSDPEFCHFVEQQFMQHQIDPSRLAFEITETDVIKSFKLAINTLNHLKAHGCTILLDDFGSGVSSFSYLTELPIDMIKIDGVFIRDLLNTKTNRAIVRSVVDIADTLGLKTVAEFVENDQILQQLRELKVNYAQGYGIHMPEPLIKN